MADAQNLSQDTSDHLVPYPHLVAVNEDGVVGKSLTSKNSALAGMFKGEYEVCQSTRLSDTHGDEITNVKLAPDSPASYSRI